MVPQALIGSLVHELLVVRVVVVVVVVCVCVCVCVWGATGELRLPTLESRSPIEDWNS